MVIEHNVVYNPYNYNFVGLVAEALVHAYLEQDDMCRGPQFFSFEDVMEA